MGYGRRPRRPGDAEPSYSEEGGQLTGPTEASDLREDEGEGEGAASKEGKKLRRREKYDRQRIQEQKVKERVDRLCAELDTRRRVRSPSGVHPLSVFLR